MTNNFGCTWDTTLTVEVLTTRHVITAGPDQIFCSNPVNCKGPWTMVSVCGGAAGTYKTARNNENTVFSYWPDTPGDGTMMRSTSGE